MNVNKSVAFLGKDKVLKTELMAILRDTIFRELDLLQYGDTEKFLLVKQLPFGLGGQYQNRIDALRCALATGRKAVFEHHNDPPYSQSFEQMFSCADEGLDWVAAEPVTLGVWQTANAVIYDVGQNPGLFAKASVIDTTKAIEKRLALRSLDREYLDAILFEWMRPLPTYSGRLADDVLRLGVNAQTLGVHIRRGDKSVETPYVPASEFNRVIGELHDEWQFESIYITSDSDSAVDEITPPNGVRIIFDRTERRYNNANHRMLLQNGTLAKQETYTAHKNIMLLCQCGGLVGQDNAHFATISSRVIKKHLGHDATIRLIEGTYAEDRSPLLSKYYLTKRVARSFAKRIFPNLTASALAKRRPD